MAAERQLHDIIINVDDCDLSVELLTVCVDETLITLCSDTENITLSHSSLHLNSRPVILLHGPTNSFTHSIK